MKNDNVLINPTLVCCDCKYHVPMGDDYTDDECHHKDACYDIKGGIREPAQPVFYRCKAMLAGICRNHQLFVPKEPAVINEELPMELRV